MRTPDRATFLVLAFAVAACRKRDEVAEIDRVIATRPSETSVPAAAIGGRIDEATGLPYGYPTDLAIVPGFRIESGGVEPGAVRTATLRYDETTDARYIEALSAAMTAKGQRIERDQTSASGAHRLRLSIGDRHATAVVTSERSGVRVDFMMFDRAARP